MPRHKISESAAEALRERIGKSGLSLREIGRASGAGAAVVSRFMRRERDMLLGTAERIAAAVGARLKVVRQVGQTDKRKGR